MDEDEKKIISVGWYKDQEGHWCPEATNASGVTKTLTPNRRKVGGPLEENTPQVVTRLKKGKFVAYRRQVHKEWGKKLKHQPPIPPENKSTSTSVPAPAESALAESSDMSKNNVPVNEVDEAEIEPPKSSEEESNVAVNEVDEAEIEPSKSSKEE